MTAISVQQFGKHTLLERLATGGSAELWRAKTVGAAGFERQVAVKRFLPNLTSSREFVKKLIAESTRAAQLSHANIVQILHFDQVGGSYYLAMELIEGRDLRQLQRRAKERGSFLSVNQAAHIICELLKALAYAHEKKEPVLHKEISTQNILISFQGEVKLTTFGTGDTSLLGLEAGAASGKAPYFSPEQAQKKAPEPRSDLFMLGAVFYELLTQEQIFAGKDLSDTLSQILTKPVPAPSQKNPKVPKELDAFVLSLLEKEPEKRPKSAKEAQRVLADFLHAAVTDYSDIDVAAYICDLFAEELGPDVGIPETERMNKSGALPEEKIRTAKPADTTGPMPAQAKKGRGAGLWVGVAALLAALGALAYFLVLR